LHVARLHGRCESEGWRLRKDGTRFWAQATVTALTDDTGGVRGYAKLTRDVTERKQADEDLRSYATRLISTSRRLLTVQEAERRRLAGDLHDHVGPNLTALGIKLELLEEKMSAESRSASAGLVVDAKALLRETTVAIRYVMSELRPQDLADYGLVAALHGLSRTFSRRAGIAIDAKDLGDAVHLPASVELAMYRIAQETLNNAGKYSRANRVTMRLDREGGVTALEIRDDGIGFDRTQIEAKQGEAGWGLIIMRERAEAVGARFELEAKPEEGVRVRVTYSG
jgi:signal transduction histidine kinase